jgi:hypothetical protein
VLDDVTPLEQGGPTLTAALQLFAPRAAYRWVDRARGIINYSVTAEPKSVQVQILDRDGKLVRELKPQNQRAGLNRVNWDLRWDPPHLVELRTTPRDNPHIWDEPRFKGKETRPVTHWGLDPAEVGPLATPGRYTVKLTVDGQTQTQPIEILKDPKVPTSDKDLDLSVKLQLRLRDDISASADMVNAIEIMRKQLEDARKAAGGNAANMKQIDELDRKLYDVESKILEPAQQLSDDKYFQQAYRIYMNLIWLNGEVGPGAGDVAGGANFPPTDTSVGVMEGIEKDLSNAKTDYKRVIDQEVAAFNRALPAGMAPLAAKR